MLLVLAIGASSALVFTNRVELLKLAVILALWAAVVAAFVSVIYRRQSDIDQAKVRDLKLVYDLQLDREISARREYELSVETQLRRELTSELRAQASDEVPACGPNWRRCARTWRSCSTPTCRTGPRSRPIAAAAYSDWTRTEPTGRVTSSRIDTEDREDVDAEHRGEPDHRRARRTASTGVRVGAAAELRRCAPQAVGGRARASGDIAPSSRRAPGHRRAAAAA